MKNLSVAKRIWAGFGLLLTGLLITSLIAIGGLQNVKNMIRDLNQTKIQYTYLSLVQEDYLEARLDIVRFKGNRKYEIGQEALDNLLEIREIRDEVLGAYAVSPARLEQVTVILDMIREYDDYVHIVLDHRADFEVAMNIVSDNVNLLETSIADLRERAEENSSFMIAGAMDMSDQNIDRLKSYYTKFGLLPNQDHFDFISDALSMIEVSIDRLENGAPSSWVGTLGAMRTAISTITTQVDMAYASEIEMFVIIEDDLSRLGPMAMNLIDTAWDEMSNEADTKTSLVNKTLLSSEIFTFTTMLIVFIAGIVISLLLARSVIRPLATLRDALDGIAADKTDVEIPKDRKDEFGAIAQSVVSIQSRGLEAQQIRIAVDSSSANIMIAGLENTVVYVTDSLKTLFKEAEADMRLALPSLSVTNMIGTDIDIFDLHKTGTQREHSRDLSFGTRRYRVNVSPVMDETGTRLGTVMEWQDRTDELHVQSEVDDVLRHALNGQFDRRIDAATDNQTLAGLIGNVNSLVSAFDDGMKATGTAISSLAAGDFSDQMTGDFRGAFATLQTDINATFGKLGELVSDIQITAHEINSNTGQIAGDSKSLSRRTESQAASLEETAATMEEMTSTIKNNAQNAEAATKLATQAAGQANSGGKVVENAVAAMSRIEDSSEKMSQIISVIDSIAFQTNLLALNAAVEAARAGDAGKGFAVVASEVRTLAQRSSEAAKDIKELISFSTTHVSEGVGLVSEAGTSLKTIIDAIQEVNNAITDITAMSKEQATGVDEISSALSEMDSMTQQNAAMSEQSAERSTQLARKAETLIDLVRVFKTSNQNLKSLEPNLKIENIETHPRERVKSVNRSPSPISNAVVQDYDDWKEF